MPNAGNPGFGSQFHFCEKEYIFLALPIVKEIAY